MHCVGAEPVDSIKDRIADQMVDIPVPRVMVETVAAAQEVVRLVQRIDEQTVQVPMVQTVLKTVEAPQLQIITKVGQTSVKVPRLQFIDTVGDVLVVVQRHIPMVRDEGELLGFVCLQAGPRRFRHEADKNSKSMGQDE